MVWYYDITDGDMDVYDHEGTLVRTVVNDGSGHRIPEDVLDIMHDEAEAAFTGSGFNPYLFAVFRDASFEQIEAGTPS